MTSNKKIRIWLVATRVLVLFLLLAEVLHLVNKSSLFKKGLVSRNFWEVVFPVWFVILFLAIFSFLPLYWKYHRQMMRIDIILFLVAVAGIILFNPLAKG